MRLAMVTPIAKRSAIARSTGLVVDALRADGHEVTVVRAEHVSVRDDGVHRFGADAHDWEPTADLLALLTAADVIVYQLGDNVLYHEGCVRLMTTFPGIVVLHDFFLANLYLGYGHYHPEIDLWALVGERYGPDAAAGFRQAVGRGGSGVAAFGMAECPMTELAVEAARGVVCHSRWGIDRVFSAAAGPVTALPLPYDAHGVDADNPSADDPSADKPERVVLTFGNINDNKRAESIIRVLGSDPSLRLGWRYRLVGAVSEEYRAKLVALADMRKVSIEFTGPVDDAELTAAILDADLVSCLRFPALEASSASTVEAMLLARPVIVTETGFYRELPSDLVVKIDPDDELRGLHETFSHFEELEDEHRTRGMRARVWAKQTFDPASYAVGLIDLAERVRAQEPVVAALSRIGHDLSAWGAAPDSVLGAAVLDKLQDVWAPEPDVSLAALG